MTDHSSHIIIGVDGGGTGCRAAVGTLKDGILASTTGGPGNVESDFDGAIATITACVQEALIAAGLGDAQPASMIAHVGVAGANDAALLRHTSDALPYAQTQTTNDRATTVRGVLGAQDGYVVALGTGTIVACQHNQDLRSVGGWGFYVSDQASGAWLGRKALEYAVMACDGVVDHTALSQAITRHFGGAAEIFVFTSRARPKDYASLAPEVMEAAQKGDTLATSLVKEGVAYVERALNTLRFTTGDILCLSGGLGPHYAPYLDPSFTQNLAQPQGTALDGAFALACDLAKTQGY